MGMVERVLERKERVRDRPVWRPQNLSFLTWNQKTGSEPMTNGRAAEGGPKVSAGPEELNSPLPCRVGVAGTEGSPLKPPAFRCSTCVCNPQGLPGKGAMPDLITLWLGCTHSIWDQERDGY